MNKYCQSCGMPMKRDPQNRGTNADNNILQGLCDFNIMLKK